MNKKVDRNTDILYNHITDAKKTLRILITKQCNLNCIYCYEEWRKNSTNTCLQNLDLQDFKNIIYAAKEIGVYRISFSWWEPLIYYSWLDELIKLCISLKIICTITTNWTSNKIVSLAKKYPSLKIRISLDQSNSEDYFHYKKTNTFDTVMQNLKELAKLDNEIHINRVIVSLRNEWEKFNDMIKLIKENKLNKKNIALKLLPCYPNDKFNKLSVEKLINYYSSRKIVLNHKYDKLRRKEKPYFLYKNVNVLIQARWVYSPKCCTRKKFKCTEGIGSIRINPDWVIQPCFGVQLEQIKHRDEIKIVLKKLKNSQKFLEDLYMKTNNIDKNLNT